MDILISLATVAIFVIAVTAAYYRFRDNFSDLAAATDSKQSGSFWTGAALIYAIRHCCSLLRLPPRPWLVETVIGTRRFASLPISAAPLHTGA